jgi:uncharacterized protein YciI
MGCFRVFLALLVSAIAVWPQEMANMTTYAVVFLKRGPKWTAESSPELEKLQQAHLAHMNRMAKEGKLILAGPFMDGGTLRGMCVYGTSVEDARALASEDPAVKAGRLEVEVKPWFSAKGLKTPVPEAAK